MILVLYMVVATGACNDRPPPQSIAPQSLDGSASVSRGDAQPKDGPEEEPTTRFTRAVDLALGAFIGEVRGFRTDAVRHETVVSEQRWVIYFDEVTFAAERWVGSATGPDVTALMPPTHCEGFYLDGRPIPDGRISICTSPESSFRLRPGDRLLGLIGGRGTLPSQLSGVAPRTGDVIDLSSLAEEPMTADEVWALVTSRWERKR